MPCLLFQSQQLTPPAPPPSLTLHTPTPQADGFAHSLRLYFLPQYAGDSSALVDLANGGQLYPGGKQAFMEDRLGQTAARRWDELGYLVAIVLAAMVLMTAFYAKCSHVKR